MDAFFSGFTVLSYSYEEGISYGIIRSSLRKAGEPIRSEDLFIAAHALHKELTLVTNNVKEFAKVDGLELANWAEEE